MLSEPCCCRGDQHDPRYFDYFAENNLIHHFAKFLEQKGNRRGDVAKQVLQTLSILIQNIRSTTAIFYLFSNNVVNEIVAMRFDFEDDEVLGYFINLLKTISLKFNASTVQFFFQVLFLSALCGELEALRQYTIFLVMSGNQEHL
jgi:protein CLEC16A